MKLPRALNIMEVCGTHTMAIARHGLRTLFPRGVRLLSGPGCPVCVTPTGEIDRAIALAQKPDVIITTFGDMLRVPGSSSSLERERSQGADVRILYSAFDALDIAARNPSNEVVFIGVGFETTAPTIAATVKAAKAKKIRNFSVLPFFKTIPRALETILSVKERRIDGFLMPGHVTAIIGTGPYEFIPKKYGIPCVVAGFEAADIMRAVEMILRQVESGDPKVEIEYSRVVHEGGNKEAQKILKEVFSARDSSWRGIGVIPGSGLTFSSPYRSFNAENRFSLPMKDVPEPGGCRCGDILLGLAEPRNCGFFGRKCTPSDPVGPCMVSTEGACAAEYKYGGNAKCKIQNSK